MRKKGVAQGEQMRTNFEGPREQDFLTVYKLTLSVFDSMLEQPAN